MTITGRRRQLGLRARQMTSKEEELLSLDFYARKTFFKTASLMANSCKAIALLGGQPAAVAQLAHDYGRHLGLAFQARLAPASPWVVRSGRAVRSGRCAFKFIGPRVAGLLCCCVVSAMRSRTGTRAQRDLC